MAPKFEGSQFLFQPATPMRRDIALAFALLVFFWGGRKPEGTGKVLNRLERPLRSQYIWVRFS